MNQNNKYQFIRKSSILFVLMFAIILNGCKKDLKETPLDFLNSGVILTNKAGFETAITALHAGAREERFGEGARTVYSMQLGTDMYTTGDQTASDFKDYNTWQTPANDAVIYFWEWAYLKMIPRANNIIDYAERPTAVWANEAEKNAIVAEAKFFRGYAYNVLANLYGGVPIVDKIYTEPKLDFTRNTRDEVLNFVKTDLQFASNWLPKTTTAYGRIVKGAADHLLSEVFISLKQYDSAIARASAVINDPTYKLMTNRFGSKLSLPGDVFSDLFKDKNQNRTSGNTETLWAMQFEFQTPGGSNVATSGNNSVRAWGPRYHAIKDPANASGMVVCDSLLRPVGWVRGTNHFNYTIWQEDWNDMRNSINNIRREFYYNNPTSTFFGKKVDPATSRDLDTMYWYYPYIRKIEGDPLSGNGAGFTFVDFYVYRLSETYLLRAEAYHLKGDNVNAAGDINIVRARAKAIAVTPNRVNLDYILDERARELSVEEPRRRTLIRMGKLVERTKLYNLLASTRNSIQDKHQWFPIPQKAIDANINAVLTQNPGY